MWGGVLYFYVKCHLSRKISRIKEESWVMGLSKFKLGYTRRDLTKMASQNFDFFYFGPKFGTGFSYGPHLQNIGFHDSNAKDLRSFALKLTELDFS